MVTMVRGITSRELVGDLDQTGLAPMTAGRLDGLQAAVIDEPLALQVPGQPQVGSPYEGSGQNYYSQLSCKRPPLGHDKVVAYGKWWLTGKIRK